MAVSISTMVAKAGNTDTGNAIFNDKVRTLQVHTASAPDGITGMPVIIVGNEDAVIVEFDHLDTDRQYLRYSLTHCDSQWQPDGLAYVEYLDGFNEGTVDNYEFSLSTTVPYVHYTIAIPGGQMRPYLSGNYLLKVYAEDDEDDVWLQCRFAISEQTAAIGVNATSRTDIDYNREHQQLEVHANIDHSNVRDPFNDLTLVIEQNARPDTRVSITKPMRISGGTLVYEHQSPLIFSAGNEYRRFETVSKRYTPMGVASFDYMNPYYRYTLQTDTPRSHKDYLYDQTLGGGFLVRDADDDTRSENADVTADYAVVFFSLEMPELPGVEIFIDGDMVNRRFDPTSAMDYNNATGCYEKALLLKQGAYSYQYVALRQGQPDATASTKTVEGDKYQTRNRYTVYLYHRRPGERYDRLAGYTTVVL